MKSTILRDSLTGSFASILSVFSSLAATVLIVGAYGLKANTDAYYVAIILSNLAVMIFQVSVGSVLVPAISRARIEGSDHAEDRMVHSLLVLGILAGLAVYAFLALTASPLARMLAPGFDEETSRVAENLFRFACIGVALAFPSEVLRAYLNTKGAFGWPAAAEAIRTGTIAIAIVVAPQSWGIYSAIVGFSLGHILQFLFLLALAIGKGLRPAIAPDFRNPQLRSFLRELRHPVVGNAANFAPFLLQRFLASLLPEGSVAVFALAQQITFMLFAVTLKAVSTASHPEVSRHAANRNAAAMNDTLVRSLKLSALIGCAAFIVVATLNRDAVNLVAGFRMFTHENAGHLSAILLVLTITLPVNGLPQVLRLPYYAHGNARLPARHMMAMGFVHALALVALSHFFGLMGIAFAQVLWVWLTMATCFMLLPAASKSIIPKCAPVLARLVFLSMAMGLTLFAVADKVSPIESESPHVLRLLWMGVIALIAASLTLTMLRLAVMRDYEDVFGPGGYRALASRVVERISPRKTK